MDMARVGWRVALVERARDMIGGTCINVACIPSKTLIRSAEVGELARRAADFGVGATLDELDTPALRARKESVVEGLRAMNLEQFLASGIAIAPLSVQCDRITVITDPAQALDHVAADTVAALRCAPPAAVGHEHRPANGAGGPARTGPQRQTEGGDEATGASSPAPSRRSPLDP